MKTNTTFRIATAMLIPILAIALSGVLHAEEKKDEHGKKDEAPHKAPETYSEGVQQIEMHRDEIAELIKTAKLDDVHHHAEQIKKIAEKLAKLASKDDSGVAKTDIKEINLTAKALAAKFDPIDKAGDAGNKAETQKVFDEMVALIATLKKFATKK